jgi:O-antigen/teichoic acid export membrane protein
LSGNNLPPIDAKRALIRGAAWGVAMRWSIKLLGLISTLVLARILTPADYGLVAMAMLMVGLIEVFIDFGIETGLVRMNKIDRDDIDSAWTLRLIQGLVLSLLLAVLAPYAGVYFKEPRVVWVIWIIALGSFIAGASNIGITLARKELNFGLEFRYNVITKLAATGVTIVAAFIIRDYRALVIGVMFRQIGGCILSYVMHPYRPKWNTTRIRDMWHFGKWMLVSGIGNFATRRIDELVAGRIADAHGLGIYNVGADLGQLPTSEIGPPMMRAILPTLSAIQDDKIRVRSAVLKTLAAINTLTLPAGIGLAVVAMPATLVLLGSQWIEAADILAVFAIVGALKITVGPLPSLMLLNGLGRIYARIMWVEFIAFAIAAALLTQSHGLMGLAYARLTSAAIYVLVYLLIVSRYAEIRLVDMLSAVWRPTVGAGLMGIAINYLSISGYGALVELIVQATFGAVVYTLWIVVSWRLVGMPDGLETIVLQALRKRLMHRF